MPPIEINGASRRVLALSFVLALCAESQTYAPLDCRLATQLYVRHSTTQHAPESPQKTPVSRSFF